MLVVPTDSGDFFYSLPLKDSHLRELRRISDFSLFVNSSGEVVFIIYLKLALIYHKVIHTLSYMHSLID